MTNDNSAVAAGGEELCEKTEAKVSEAAVAAAATTPGKTPRRARAIPQTKATKKDQLIRMLGTKAGVDAVAIGAKLGWQSHTVRAALSGLRKAGHMIVVDAGRGGKPIRYRIALVPAT